MEFPPKLLLCAVFLAGASAGVFAGAGLEKNKEPARKHWPAFCQTLTEWEDCKAAAEHSVIRTSLLSLEAAYFRCAAVELFYDGYESEQLELCRGEALKATSGRTAVRVEMFWKVGE